MTRRTSHTVSVAGLLTLAAVVSFGTLADPSGSTAMACTRQAQLLKVHSEDESTGNWLGALTQAARALHGADRWQGQLSAGPASDLRSALAPPPPGYPSTRTPDCRIARTVILAQSQLIDLPPPALA